MAHEVSDDGACEPSSAKRLVRIRFDAEDALQGGSTLSPRDVLVALDELDYSRRALARVRRALDRVTDLHRAAPIIEAWGKSNSKPDDFLVCVECTDVDNWWCEYPCPTLRAIAASEHGERDNG